MSGKGRQIFGYIAVSWLLGASERAARDCRAAASASGEQADELAVRALVEYVLAAGHLVRHPNHFGLARMYGDEADRHAWAAINYLIDEFLQGQIGDGSGRVNDSLESVNNQRPADDSR